MKVSDSVLVGQQILAPALSGYMSKYPAVMPLLVLTNSLVNLIKDGFDMAFRIGSNEVSSLISQTVGRFPQRLYASPDYLDQHGTPKTPQELPAHACLVMGEAAPTHHYWQFAKGDEKTALDIAPPPHSSMTSSALRQWPRTGIALLPEYAAYDALKNGAPVTVLEKWLGPVSELSAIYPSRRGATAKVRLLIDEVKQHLTSITVLDG